MAIYHFSAKIISRGKGQSAVASASYRSGEKLEDERTGETKYYHREVKPDSLILAPSHAPEWTLDREKLWNEVEKVEKNHNSQLSREFEVSLPRELSHDQQKELIKNFAQEQFVNRGMVADIAIHRDDKNNPHAHIMCTMRAFKENGDWENKKRKEYILDENGEKELDKKGKPKYVTYSITDWDKQDNVSKWREQWSIHANKSLELEGFGERIDHRSHADRGLETLPTQHLGHVAHAMEKAGRHSDRGDYNREVEAYNEKVIELAKYREEKLQLEKELKQQRELEQLSTPAERTHLQSAQNFLKKEPTFESIAKRLAQLSRFENKNDRLEQSLNKKNEDFKEIKDYFSGIKSAERRIENKQEKIDDIGFLKGLSRHNRKIKTSAENDIQQEQAVIEKYQQKLAPHLKEYNFNTDQEFSKVHEHFYERWRTSNQQTRSQRGAIRRERDVLQKANTALESRFVRELASNYPNSPEMAYLDFKTAKAITDINKKQNKITSIDEMREIREHFKKDAPKFAQYINHATKENERLNRVENYLKGYQEANAIVERYENNPVYRGQLERGKLSRADKKIYEDALSERTRYRQLSLTYGVKDEQDLHEQRAENNQFMDRVPQLQEHGAMAREGASLFDGLIQGIEQAQRQMEQQKQRENSTTRTKQKNKQKGLGDLELGG